MLVSGAIPNPSPEPDPSPAALRLAREGTESRLEPLSPNGQAHQESPIHSNGELPHRETSDVASPTNESDPTPVTLPLCPIPQPPIAFIFRENGLYEGYVDALRKVLEARGQAVLIYSFPSDTQTTVIRAELLKQKTLFSDAVVFADRTVSSTMAGSLSCGSFSPSYLDNIFSGCCLRIICKELGILTPFEVEVPETKGPFLRAYLNAHRARFQMVLKRAFREAVPDRIVVDSRCLHEHAPFHMLHESKDGETRAAAYLKKWIQGAGYPEARIIVTNNVSRLRPERFVKDSVVWFFGDRHWQDQSRGQAELNRLTERIEGKKAEDILQQQWERLQVEMDLDEDVEGSHRPDERGRYERDERPEHQRWDGDDGLDLEPDDFSELTSSGQDTPDEVDRRLMGFHEAMLRFDGFDELPSGNLKVARLALPMDSLLESMVAAQILKVSTLRSSSSFLDLTLEQITEQLPGLITQMRPKPLEADSNQP
ncbi:MAG: hypothetical protein J0M12_02340 [Deltaproteobacteria bacterium]|nr:hypothetical protein [Deltaproteobacteria bacterium]